MARALEQAVQYHRQGRLGEAERFYREALRASPRDFDTLHMLGVLKLQQGGAAEAVPFLQRAVEVRPNALDVLSNLSVALLALGRPADALANLDKILSVQPGDAGALFGRGTVLAQLGRGEEALAALDRTLAIKPDHVGALFNRATIRAGIGRYMDALADYDRVVVFMPHHADALNNRGNVLAQLERYEEAAASYERALAIKPDHVSALSNRAVALRQLGRYEEALACCDRALAIDPNHVDLLNNRGNVLLQLNRAVEAIECYQRVLSMKRESPEALVNCAFAFHGLGSFAEALQCAEDAVAIDPRYANAFLIRGHVLAKLDRHGEAAQSYERALALDPAHPYALGASVMAYLAAGNWERIEALLPMLETEIAAQRAVIPPFNLLGLPISPAVQLQCARHFVMQRLPQVQPIASLAPRRSDRIKLAYLSGDFRRHPVGFGIVELLERHDRTRFEVIGISYGPDDGSETRGRIAAAVDQFYDVRERADRDVAALLSELAVDIVIDLAGHTENSRMGILAHRPAPIQLIYYGYAGTTGADFVDYVLADQVALPPDQQPFFAEKIVELPDTFFANDSTRAIASARPSREQLGLPDEAFVFCCFNNGWKINRPVFDVWARLLRAVEGSVLWLSRLNHDVAAKLSGELTERGIDPARAIPLSGEYLETADYLARFAQADLFLDTLPYNAHSTASDALWAGLPVVTCQGSTFAGRVAASLLHAVGLPELVTASLDDYEALALKLAGDRVLLASLRDRLAQNRLSHPLFDTARLARHLEAAYTTMWETWQRGDRPKAFSVAPIER